MTQRIAAVVALLLSSGVRAELPQARPDAVGLDAARLARIDAAVADALKAGNAPGAVVLVLRQGKVVYRKAHGQRATQPKPEPMTLDTVFDLASLTKPIATASSVMLLLERGKLRLADTAAHHLPAFGNKGKDRITIEHLLQHTSGLIADNALADYKAGRKKALENVHGLGLKAPVGDRFIYSDVGFIVLGEIVEKLSGESLDAFARKNLFEPLGMKATTFTPGKDLAARAAPTEKVGDKWLRGEVHDPRARLMGGVAGHAGLFGTADDLATFAQMLLSGGKHNGKQVLSPATVRLMTTPRPVPGGTRALGWDADTRFSSNRGELFGGFGHTGFTGTSMWIDPPSQTAVIVLTNRVHPTGKGNVVRLRSRIATLVASAIIEAPFPDGRAAPAADGDRAVLTGLEVLKREKFKRLAGRKVALVTNHTGVDADGASIIDLVAKAPGVKLVALFSPEHGIRGALDKPVDDGKDEKTGLPVYSLYGKRRRPTKEQLAGVDTLIYDIQDIGCRFYTYITTLGYILEAAAEHKLNVLVLDRPNPIGGTRVEGPVLDKKAESFVGYHPIPVRHGLTVGELAKLFNAERKIGAKLEVVEMQGWSRSALYDRTGLPWVSPSPNMRALTAALLYPGVGLLETTNVSVGRGTDRPFEVLGAPWMDGRKLAAALNAARVPGVRFVPTRFTPTSSVHAKKECGGIQIYLTDWARFNSVPTGYAIATQLMKLHPREWEVKRYNRLLGHQATFEAIQKGQGPVELERLALPARREFLTVRAKYLLYK